MIEILNGRIWLVGGTRESADLALAIASLQLPCIVTVTTASATLLYPKMPGLQVWVGKLVEAEALQFVRDQQIAVILDASHPFAIEISKLAIAVATKLQIPYLRYERPDLSRDDLPISNSTNPLLVPTLEHLTSSNLLRHQRILLTIGYRYLVNFQGWHEQCTLFARILPSEPALNAALAAGFTPDRLIALRPPISADLEKALWQHWQISMVITKASGYAGGEDIKRRVAMELGTQLVVITRPSLTYPQQTCEMTEAIQFCRQWTDSGRIC